MSIHSDLWEDYENQESLFENICVDFENEPIVLQSTSRGFDSIYKDHRLNECLQGTFYLHRSLLVKMNQEKLLGSLKVLQNLSYARFHTSISQQPSPAYRVVISKKEALFELVFSDQEIFNSFVMEIRKICISSDFHKKYVILKLLAEGENSKTCIVESLEDGTKFTVRTLNKRTLMDAQNSNQKHALISQIETMRALKGCNVFELFEVHETEWNIYIVTEYVEKDSLETINKSLGSFYLLSRATTQEIMFRILETLAIFTSHGVIHRNIKPSNILIQDENNIKITNFNLAIFSSTPVSSLRICGTPGYMAPEMINFGKQEGQGYNEKCDVFAAGCIFFEMLFGYPLFDNFNLGSLSFNKITMEDIQEFVLDAAFLRPNRANEECLNLLLELLQYDSNKRISAQEALHHPFFNNLNQHDRIINFKTHSQKNPFTVSPISVQVHANFTEAVNKNAKDQATDCESITDEDLDINAKWNNLQKVTFPKNPSRNSKLHNSFN